MTQCFHCRAIRMGDGMLLSEGKVPNNACEHGGEHYENEHNWHTNEDSCCAWQPVEEPGAENFLSEPLKEEPGWDADYGEHKPAGD